MSPEPLDELCQPGRRRVADMTHDELIELCRNHTTTDLVTAGRAFGYGRTRCYEAVRDGTFPVPTLRLGGNKIRVPTRPILTALGYELPDMATPGTPLPGAADATRPMEGPDEPQSEPMSGLRAI